ESISVEPTSTEAVIVTTESVTVEVTEKASQTIPTSALVGGLHYPDGGEKFEEQLEADVIAAAQELFYKACDTEWQFTVGSPYSLDTSQYICNEYGWQFFLITEDRINSLDDVRADYHRVFSENYKDTLNEVFMEDNGRAYCLNGARGSDVFYEGSKIVEITDRADGEICFRVENSYSDDGFNGGAYTEDAEFTVVKDSDGVWRVGKFKLPY
ncbi:MAG: hypothetical protein K2G87_06275, partial [Oscillospiraceae bacterium]|nr:hypothetical protein [Oscillospiraceae bacterium]